MQTGFTVRQISAVLLTFLVAAPVAGISLWSIGRTVRDMVDPCVFWNYPLERGAHVGPNDPCRAPKFNGDSRLHTAVLAALFPGGLLTAALLGMAGATLARRGLMVAGGFGMLAGTLIAFSIFPLTILAGVTFLLVSNRLGVAGPDTVA
jgi:hypothetical protein